MIETEIDWILTLGFNWLNTLAGGDDVTFHAIDGVNATVVVDTRIVDTILVVVECLTNVVVDILKTVVVIQ